MARHVEDKAFTRFLMGFGAKMERSQMSIELERRLEEARIAEMEAAAKVSRYFFSYILCGIVYSRYACVCVRAYFIIYAYESVQLLRRFLMPLKRRLC